MAQGSFHDDDRSTSQREKRALKIAHSRVSSTAEVPIEYS
jgi:hypothetical protein